MSRSLEKRLALLGDDCEQEFLNNVKVWGPEKALRIWEPKLEGYHDTIGLGNYLEAKTGNRYFGLYPTIDASANEAPNNLVAKIETELLKADIEICRLKQELHKFQIAQMVKEYNIEQPLNPDQMRL